MLWEKQACLLRGDGGHTVAQGHGEVPKVMWEVAEVLGPSQASWVKREGPL